MGLSVKVGSFSQRTSTGSQSVTGVGFQPKAVLFFLTDKTADGSAANCQIGYGVATSSSNRWCFYGIAQSGLSTHSCSRRYSLSACIGAITAAGAIAAEAGLSSMDSDGFTVNWGTADSTARIVNYIALGGSDISGARCGEIQGPTVTGNQSFTGFGFKPTALIAFCMGTTTAAPALGAASVRPGMGFAGGGGQAMFANSIFYTTALSRRFQRTDLVAGEAASSGASICKAQLYSFDSDGFTLNWTEVYTAGRYIYYLALAGPRVKVGSFTQKTSTGTLATTGVGFQPSVLFLGSYNLAADSSGFYDGARVSVGAADGSQQFAATWGGSASGTTSDSQDLDRGAVLKMMTPAGSSPTTQAAAHLESFDADGFTLHWTTADATARQIIYLAIGPSITGTAAVTAAKASLSASGSVTPPAIAGTGAVSAKAASLSGSGIYTTPARTGTGAVTAAAATLSASGTCYPRFTGSAAVAAANGAVSSSATYTPPEKTGTAGLVAAAASVDGSGTYQPPGGGAVVAAPASLAASGSYAPPEKTGTAAVAGARAALSASGTHTPAEKTGDAAVAAPAAVIAASGVVTGPTYTGAASVTAKRASASAAGAITRSIPPPSEAAIRVINWLRPAS